MDLMSAHGQHVDPQFLWPDPELAVSLDRVHMVQNMTIVRPVILCYDPARFLYRLERSDLVVDIHCRDQDRLVTQFSLQIFNTYMSQGIHRKMRDPEPGFLQHAQRLQDSRMLYGCRNNVVSCPFIGHGSPDQSPVIGLRASGGEIDLGRCHAKCRRDPLFRLAEILLGIHAFLMSGRRIPEVFPHRFLYDLNHALRNRSGCGIIQICFHTIHHFPDAASAWPGSPDWLYRF